MISEAWAMLNGQVLYRDIYQIHPPFQFFIFIPFLFLLSPAYVSIGVNVFNTILVLAGTLLMRRLMLVVLQDAWVATAAAVLYVYWLGLDWATSAHGEFYTSFIMLVTAYVILSRQSISLRSMFLIGFAWGLAFFIKQIALFDILPLAFVLVFLQSDFVQKRKILLLLPLGFFSATLLAFAYSIYHGSLKQAVDSLLVRNVLLYSQLQGQTFSIISAVVGLLRKFADTFIQFLRVMAADRGTLFLLFPLSVFSVCFFSKEARGKQPGWLRYLNISVLWMLSVFLGLALLGRFYGHYLLSLITPLILFYSLWIIVLSPPLRRVVSIAVVIACTSLSVQMFFVHNSEKAAALGSIQRSERISQLIQRQTSKDDPIFLLDECNLDIFYRARRLSANGIYMYLDMDARHTKDREAEAVMENRLTANPPKIIVWGKCSWPDYPVRSFFKSLIEERYVLHSYVEGARIYLRKGSG